MSAYTSTVTRRTLGLKFFSVGMCPDCEDCAENFGLKIAEYNRQLEAGMIEWGTDISARWCDSCGTTTLGKRYPCHWVCDDRTIGHGDVCTDCYGYHANGEEPEDWP